ncbi:MAG: hypothetical protein A2X12_03655 [Bacteroidetes bacterium GWE2_29_8]|nr:MAG: hypothetical protein A2X12_03655 [Bacteroidetes bacterium GWE2_29_8]
MNKRKHTLKYITLDIISSIFAWILFIFYIGSNVRGNIFVFGISNVFSFNINLVLIPLFWLLLYILSGTYRSIYRKSRLLELGHTILITFIGVIILFFSVIMDDINVYGYYYKSFFSLFFLHVTFTFIPRFIITSITAYKIQHKIIGFNTLFIGCNRKLLEIYFDIDGQIKSYGNKFVGFVSINGNKSFKDEIEKHLKYLGNLNDIKEIIKNYNIEEVIIVIEDEEKDKLNKIINILSETAVIIKINTDLKDILLGKVKTSGIFNYPLIEIPNQVMPEWQMYIKNVIDIIVSIFALIFLFPLFIILSIGIKMTSLGPIFYSHERIGIHGKPFRIFKFRSMYVDAEKDGPSLSSKDDKRITSFGKFMRKTRLDELPQFYNILKGEMSLVGPRPERIFFINQITLKAPHYNLIFKVKPGLTSWGQIKYGYAENVDQMIERLKYDILYIKNMSLFLDFKILIYTIIIVLQRRGK